MTNYNTKVDLANENGYTKFDLDMSILKILNKNRILTSIKGRSSVAKLQKNEDLQSQCRSCQL